MAKKKVLPERRFWCPQCKGAHNIDVAATIWVRITENSMDNVQTDADEADDGSHEWDGSSPAICRACGYTGTVDDFDNDEATIAAIERKEAGLTEEVE